MVILMLCGGDGHEPKIHALTLSNGNWLVEITHRTMQTLQMIRLTVPGKEVLVPLPSPPGTTLFALVIRGGAIRVMIDGPYAGVALYARPMPIWYRLPLLGQHRRLAAVAITVGNATLCPAAHRPLAGGRTQRRRWQRSLRVAHDLGLLAPASARSPSTSNRPAKVSAQVGAHLHLFYPDLWPDCAAVLAHLPPGASLHITGPELPPNLAATVRATFPAATLHVVENVGQDVWPFVSLLSEGAFDGLDVVLKLHAKKSQHSKILPCVGALWRRAAFGDLAGSPATVAAAVARFADAPDMGMLGPARLRVPNARYDETSAWGSNRAQALAIAERLGLDPDAVQLDYFAGTMFWVRPAMLGLLRRAGLRAADFAPGGLAADGGLSHALERLLPALVKAAGGRVEDIPPPA